jgi:hypothetical protein
MILNTIEADYELERIMITKRLQEELSQEDETLNRLELRQA